MAIRIPMLVAASISGLLFAGMPPAVADSAPRSGEISYLITNGQNCSQSVIDNPQGGAIYQQALFTVACEPTLAPPTTPVPLAAYTGVGLIFSGFADASTTQTIGRDAFGVTYSVYGWVDSDDQCAYTPQLSHFESATVTSGRRVGPAGNLTLDVDNYQAGRRFGNWNKPAGLASVVTAFHSIAGASPQKKLCAISGAAVVWRFGGLVFAKDDRFLAQSQAKRIIPVRARIASDGMIPNEPQVSSAGTALAPGSTYEIRSTIGGNINDGRLVSRTLSVGTATRIGGQCVGTAAAPLRTFNRTASGVGVDQVSSRIPNDPSLVGRYLCAFVEVLNDLGFRATGAIAYVPIEATANPAPTPTPSATALPSLAQAIAAATSAQSALSKILATASSDQSAVRAALLAAQRAQTDLQSALGNANGGNANGGSANAGNAGQAQPTPTDPGQAATPDPAEVERARQELARLTQEITNSGVTLPPAESAPAPDGRATSAAAAAGIDLGAAPLVDAAGRGTGASSAITLNVAASPTVNRGRMITVNASVLPRSSAGKVRISLVRFNAKGQPISSKALFAPVKKGKSTKKWRIPRTYTPSDFTLVVSYVPNRKGAPGATTTKTVTIR